VIRYSYNTQTQPPAPFVHVALRNPADGSELRDVAAQIDTAADRTVLPDMIVQALKLPQMGTQAVGGFEGASYTLPTYAVLLSIHNLPPRPIKVLGAANEPWVLLGRDVVNAHRLVLDGPLLILDIS
jgi:hypothetical protein